MAVADSYGNVHLSRKLQHVAAELVNVAVHHLIRPVFLQVGEESTAEGAQSFFRMGLPEDAPTQFDDLVIVKSFFLKLYSKMKFVFIPVSRPVQVHQ